MMNCAWSRTRWMRASTDFLRARYCAFRSVNSISPSPSLGMSGVDFASQFFDFPLELLVLRHLSLQKAGGCAHLLLGPLGGEVVGVRELVLAVAEIADLEEALVQQGAQAEVDLADADAELLGEPPLGDFRVQLEQLEDAVARLVVEQWGVRSVIERRIKPAFPPAVKRGCRPLPSPGSAPRCGGKRRCPPP